MWHFFSKIKEELLALLILIPLAIVLGLVLYTWPVAQQPGNTTNPALLDVPPPAASATPTLLPTEETIADKQAEDSQPAIILLVSPATTQPSSYKITVSKTITVADLLQAAQKQGLQFSAEDYGAPLGLLVTSLNGLANDQQKKMYWYFYVNGDLSSAGASATAVVPGDTVEWRYELAREYENN